MHGANPLDRLLKPRFPSAAVGIEGDGASVVQLDRAKGAFIVKRAASVSLPAQVVRPGFESSNIREPVELATALDRSDHQRRIVASAQVVHVFTGSLNPVGDNYD